jgi:hypothetical protein
LAALAVSGQNREKFVISAKAGGVNAVSGRAELRSAPNAEWQLLNVTDDLRAGDDVRTDRDGLVEMLLNLVPTGESPEFGFQLTTTLFRRSKSINSRHGDHRSDGKRRYELAINITTPHAKMVIVRRGLYRVTSYLVTRRN